MRRSGRTIWSARLFCMSGSPRSTRFCTEQKNGSVVRRIVGYHRYEGVEAAATLADLYRSVRLFVNFFQPSFKLLEKRRDGALVKKRYASPATPHQRLMTDSRTSTEVRNRLLHMSEQLDPVKLLRDIRARQQRLVDIAHQGAPSTDAPDIEGFLQSLRVAWTDGEVRPTAKAKPKLNVSGGDPTRSLASRKISVRGSMRNHGEPAGNYWRGFSPFIQVIIRMA